MTDTCQSRRWWIALALIIALAAALRIVNFRRGGELLEGVDAAEYDTIATNLLNKGTFRTPAHGLPQGEYAVRTPGYPAFLAATYWASQRWFGSRLALVRPVQLALDLGTLLVVFALARRLLGRRRALVAAGLYAAYPGFWWAAAAAYTEILSIFLWAVTVLILTGGFDRRRARAFIAAGVIAGGATLVNPTGQAFPLLLLIALVWTYGVRDRRWLWHFLAFAVGFLVATAPWLARNCAIFRRPVGLSSVGGINFWAGNYLPFQGKFRHASYPMVRRITAGADDEMAVDAALWREGMSNIAGYLAHRPGDYAGLLWRKFRTFWTGFGVHNLLVGWRGVGLRAWHLHRALLLLALLGLLAATSSARRYAPLLAVIAFFNLAHMATLCQEGRYNLPVMPYIIILATLGLGWLFPGLVGIDAASSPQRHSGQPPT